MIGVHNAASEYFILCLAPKAGSIFRQRIKPLRQNETSADCAAQDR
jgi:hypothetical protein